MRHMTIATTITREISFFILFSLKLVFIQKIGPDLNGRGRFEVYKTKSNHCTAAQTGREKNMLLRIIITLITFSRRIIISRRTAKMDTAKAVSMVSSRAVLCFCARAVLPEAEKEDADADPFAIAHEPQELKRFSKRSNMFRVSFQKMAEL